MKPPRLFHRPRCRAAFKAGDAAAAFPPGGGSCIVGRIDAPA